MNHAGTAVVLDDCRRLFLRNRLVHLSGQPVSSGQAGGAFRMSVDLYVPYSLSTPQSDLLQEVVNYEVMWNVIRDCEQIGFQHIEAFCGEVAKRLVSNPTVRAVTVCACDALAGPVNEQGGYETLRFRAASSDATTKEKHVHPIDEN